MAERKTQRAKGKPRGRPFPKKAEEVVQPMNEQLTQQLAAAMEQQQPAATETPIPAASPPPSAPETPKRPIGTSPAPKPKRTTDPTAEAHRQALVILAEEEKLKRQILDLRRQGKKKAAEQVRQTLRTTRKFDDFNVDDTGDLMGGQVKPGFIPRWVSLRNFKGDEDPRQMRVRHMMRFDAEIVKDADGKEVRGAYGVLMQMKVEGRAEMIARNAPRGLAAISRLEGEVEEEIAQENRKRGGAWGRVIGEDLEFDHEQYAREGRSPYD